LNVRNVAIHLKEEFIHTSTHNKYIAWCRSTHIQNKNKCSMIFMKEERIHIGLLYLVKLKKCIG